MEPYINIVDLTVSYTKNGNPLFKDVSLKFNGGEFTLIMGPNGGGKTTLLKSIVGLVKPLKGEIRVLGRDPFKDLNVRKRVGYVPQIMDVNIYAPLTLWDLVSFGRYPHLGVTKSFSKEDEDIVYEAIKKVGLEKYVDYKLSELSGGQLSRGFIARALAQQPEIYLLDEPFESIDYVSEKVILDVLKEESKAGKLVIVTEHHLSDVEYMDRVVLFNRGVVADGSPKEVFKDEILRKAYGGVE